MVQECEDDHHFEVHGAPVHNDEGLYHCHGGPHDQVQQEQYAGDVQYLHVQEVRPSSSGPRHGGRWRWEPRLVVVQLHGGRGWGRMDGVFFQNDEDDRQRGEDDSRTKRDDGMEGRVSYSTKVGCLPRHPARAFELVISSPCAGVQGWRGQEAGTEPDGKQQQADNVLVHEEHGVSKRRLYIKVPAGGDGSDRSQEHGGQRVVEETLDTA